MQYPNLRYGKPEEMRHYALCYGSTAELARALRRSERSVKDWLSGDARVPWWVPEILRLKKLEHDNMVRQMTGRIPLARLGIVQAGTIVDAGMRFKPVEPLPVEADDAVKLRLVG
ncbi:hypothetical protein LXA47_01940 [Massilia sp. P8910]|uniref:hypothetical protein n=1 Tax=Massilia antarctica TaxID=2765360 RepID=UPI001E4E5722|nr:hypothetical protein [Massilia antarctica]MCE3602374.1 hypothetical protein [Massilia antarctica]